MSPVSTTAPTTSVAPAPAASQAPVDDAIQPSALPLAPPLPHAPRPTTTTRRAPAALPAGCDPPYTVDANGYRKYKRECASY
jgi:serine/threonine-protein kinase